MIQDRKEYMRAYYKAHKEELKAQHKAWRESKEGKALRKAWRVAHNEEIKDYKKAWNEEHKEERKAYNKSDVNLLNEPKVSVRRKSNTYLAKYGTKIPGYEIHHCCTYTEPYKFIYCSKEIHLKIHQYLRDNNIEADSNHFEQIKHLLDDSVVLYGI